MLLMAEIHFVFVFKLRQLNLFLIRV